MDANRNKVLRQMETLVLNEPAAVRKQVTHSEAHNARWNFRHTLHLRPCACRSAVRYIALMLNDVYWNLTNRGRFLFQITNLMHNSFIL